MILHPRRWFDNRMLGGTYQHWIVWAPLSDDLETDPDDGELVVGECCVLEVGLN